MTLVSAPAGYGKSVLVSSWLESGDRLYSWFSLDEDVNDLNTFLRYFITALRELFPPACANTLALISSPVKHSFKILSSELINELSEIKTRFIFVLDDYGFIHDSEIHDMFNFLIKYLPHNLQLVLITRRDPPLSLASLRGSGKIVDIRQMDLKFTKQETTEFLSKVIIGPLDEKSLTKVDEVTEGWPAGLRLLGLSLDQDTDTLDSLRNIRSDTRDIQEYLIAEVLSRQSTDIRSCLLKTSILKRFCPSLCKALCGEEYNCEDFAKRLINSNLFCIPLDKEYEWVRYHHLFQNLLNIQLERRYDEDEIQELHRKASHWFEKHGYFEESIQHLLKIDAIENATIVIANHRHELMNNENWHRLRNLLKMLPHDLINKNPHLLIVNAWLHVGSPDMGEILNRVKPLLPAPDVDTPEDRSLLGEYYSLRSNQYFIEANGQNALLSAKKALEILPDKNISARSFAYIILGVAYQMAGNLKKARSVIYDNLHHKKGLRTPFHSRLLSSLCFINWIEGDLIYMDQTTEEYMKLGQELNINESIAHGFFFKGMINYEQNDLVEAEKYLTQVARDVKELYMANSNNYIHSVFALAMTFMAMNKPEEATYIVDGIIRFSIDSNSPGFLKITRGFLAELALRQGRLAEAVKWSEHYEPFPLQAAYRFYVPQITLAKIYLEVNTEKSLDQAAELLNQMNEFYRSTHNTCFLIKVLALQALLKEAKGNAAEAGQLLVEALSLAEPGGFVRSFVDMGPQMAKLLERLADDKATSDYTGKLLVEFERYKSSADTSRVSASLKAHPDSRESQGIDLTNREHEILEFLGQRMSDQEIADRLFISYTTVKKHAANIYRKLKVKNRRQAVKKAAGLDIISPN